MEPTTVLAQCNVWPRCHAFKDMGPYDIRIGHTFQYGALLHHWEKDKVKLTIVQPDPESNITAMGIQFGPVPESKLPPDVVWHNARTGRLTDSSRAGKRTGRPIATKGTIRVYLRRRICDTLPHPVPSGAWIGTLAYTDDWAYYAFQLCTMRVVKVEKPRKILLPGDSEFNEPSDPAKELS